MEPVEKIITNRRRSIIDPELLSVRKDSFAGIFSLDVSPPATPKYSGGVERANKTLREEFYADPNLLANSLGEMQFELQMAIKKYNEYRPHFALNGLTPLQDIPTCSEPTLLSHFM